MIKKKTLSMQFLIAASLCTSILASSIFFLVITYRGMIGNIVSATENSTEYIAQTVNQSVKVTLAPSEATVRLLCLSKVGEAKTLAERLEYVQIFAEALNVNPIGDAAYVGYSTGEFYLLRRYEKSLDAFAFSPPANTYFLLQTKTLEADGTFQWKLWFYDKKLVLLGEEVTTKLILDPRQRKWFTQAIHHDGIVTTRPYVYFDTKEVGVSMTQKTATGSAVVGLDVTTGDLSALLSTLLITPGTELVLIDDTKEIVAYPGIGHLRDKKVGPDGAYELSALDLPVLNTILNTAQKNNSLIRFHDGDKEWFGLLTTLESFYGNGLRMIIAIPKQELLENIQKDLTQQGALALLLLCVILWVGWRFGNWLTNPLHLLTEQVMALSAFQFDVPIGVPTRCKEVDELGTVLQNMTQAVNGFRAISRFLNRERDLEKMTSSVLQQLLQMIRLKQGAVYLYEEKSNVLHLIATEGGTFPQALPVNTPSLDDAALIFSFQKSLGNENIYALLRNREQDLIGLLCLTCDEHTPPDVHNPQSSLAKYIENLAGAVAIAIETRQLLHTQKALLDSLIKLIADAIDTKSLYTGGHCRRVPEFSLMLLEAVTKSGTPPFEHFSLSKAQNEEFRIAAWLHDCGKITTPEYVVDKATKLETIFNRLHEIRTRFEVLHRDATIRYLEALLKGDDPQEVKKICSAEQEALQDDFAFVAKCNIGGEAMEQKDLDRLITIGNQTWWRYFDNRLGLSKDELMRMENSHEPTSLPVQESLLIDKAWHEVPWQTHIPPVQANDPNNHLGFDMKLPRLMYNYGELYNLSVKRGTLTEEERFKINDHIVQTLSMLANLPLPKNLSKVPDIASNHHETLIGTGYPRRLDATNLSYEDRIIAIADVFEALTAADRPYKEGKTLRQALKILTQMVRSKHLDKDIFNVMLRSGVYLKYAHKYLSPKQIDITEKDDLTDFFVTEESMLAQ